MPALQRALPDRVPVLARACPGSTASWASSSSCSAPSRSTARLAAFATTGIIFAAVYLLWMYQRVIFGEVTVEANRRLKDLSLREWAVLLPVLALHRVDRRLPDHVHRARRRRACRP